MPPLSSGTREQWLKPILTMVSSRGEPAPSRPGGPAFPGPAASAQLLETGRRLTVQCQPPLNHLDGI